MFVPPNRIRVGADDRQERQGSPGVPLPLLPWGDQLDWAPNCTNCVGVTDRSLKTA